MCLTTVQPSLLKMNPDMKYIGFGSRMKFDPRDINFGIFDVEVSRVTSLGSSLILRQKDQGKVVNLAEVISSISKVNNQRVDDVGRILSKLESASQQAADSCESNYKEAALVIDEHDKQVDLIFGIIEFAKEQLEKSVVPEHMVPRFEMKIEFMESLPDILLGSRGRMQMVHDDFLFIFDVVSKVQHSFVPLVRSKLVYDLMDEGVDNELRMVTESFLTEIRRFFL